MQSIRDVAINNILLRRNPLPVQVLLAAWDCNRPQHTTANQGVEGTVTALLYVISIPVLRTRTRGRGAALGGRALRSGPAGPEFKAKWSWPSKCALPVDPLSGKGRVAPPSGSADRHEHDLGSHVESYGQDAGSDPAGHIQEFSVLLDQAVRVATRCAAGEIQGTNQGQKDLSAMRMARQVNGSAIRHLRKIGRIMGNDDHGGSHRYRLQRLLGEGLPGGIIGEPRDPERTARQFQMQRIVLQYHDASPFQGSPDAVAVEPPVMVAENGNHTERSFQAGEHRCGRFRLDPGTADDAVHDIVAEQQDQIGLAGIDPVDNCREPVQTDMRSSDMEIARNGEAYSLAGAVGERNVPFANSEQTGFDQHAPDADAGGGEAEPDNRVHECRHQRLLVDGAWHCESSATGGIPLAAGVDEQERAPASIGATRLTWMLSLPVTAASGEASAIAPSETDRASVHGLAWYREFEQLVCRH